MTYRLPTRTTAAAACSSAGCGATASWGDGDPGTLDEAFAGWAIGPAAPVCPAHARPAGLVA